MYAIIEQQHETTGSMADAKMFVRLNGNKIKLQILILSKDLDFSYF